MQFDWTSFTLELLNFLVLLWILKHFLYRPVLSALDARRQEVRDRLAQADAVRKEAEALKRQYEARLAAWRQEQEQARRGFEQEMTQERIARLDALKKQLADERVKAQHREKAQAAVREAALTRQAAARAFGAAAAMLTRLASPELTSRISDLFEQDLHALPEEQRAALRGAAAKLDAPAIAEIASAHPLEAASRQSVTAALSAAAARPLQPVFKEQPELIAGLRVAVGECLLHANLADELAFFQEREVHA